MTTRLEPTDLAPHTTLHVGGRARSLAVATTPEALLAGLRGLDPAARRTVLTLGQGSNVLIADRGLDHDVLVLRADRPAALTEQDGAVTVSGAALWDDVVDLAVERGLAGIESLAGIPGTVGGAVVQNIGAYGSELHEVLHSVRAVHRETLREQVLRNADCDFAYRHSRFKVPGQPLIVLEVTLDLRPGGRHTPRYAELAAALRSAAGEADGTYDLRLTADTVRAIRGSKNMLYDPERSSTWTAGSFFTNPVVPAADRERIATALGVPASAVPSWPTAADGQVKLSAAWLIEQAGYRRGFTSGRVRLSPRHALAINNHTGEATAGEVVALARRVADAVGSRFGIALKPEPVLLGFHPDELGPLA